jgi:hypothetical protein
VRAVLYVIGFALVFWLVAVVVVGAFVFLSESRSLRSPHPPRGVSFS